MSPGTQFRILLVASIAIACFVAVWSSAFREDSEATCPSHFADGRAPTAADQKASRFLCFSQYALRYSERSKTPMWSAEHLTSTNVESGRRLPRYDRFHPETRLSARHRSELSDYVRTGYDRGHMTPLRDMATPQAQEESYSLANIAPQTPCQNQGIWERLEEATRDLALKQGELYVVTGPIYLDTEPLRPIGRGVLVPSAIFKAIYDPVTGRAGVYLSANDESGSWRTISVAELNKMSGIDAFPALGREARAEAMPLPTPRKPRRKCTYHSSGEIPQYER
ncbi:endonuclease G [Bradyrhizobium sp. USDA 4341]